MGEGVETTTHACCAGGAATPAGRLPGVLVDDVPPRRVLATAPRSPQPATTRGQVLVPAGAFWMGDAFDGGYPGDGEGPAREVTLDAFRVDPTTVTNQAWAAFAKATGHVTTAEAEGFSAVFHLAYEAAGGQGDDIAGVPETTPWWLAVAGADWRHPEGRTSDVVRRQNHPVVHVSHDDALAYCAWAGKRLLTEAEWERAARGVLERARFPWGDERSPRGRTMLNTFTGRFPEHSTGEDGYLTTAPVKTFPPNGLGLFQAAGNVWEWCADWYSADAPTATPAHDPAGFTTGETRVMRGGSYLCHDSYCHRYRVAARSSAHPTSTAANLGFRCGNDA